MTCQWRPAAADALSEIPSPSSPLDIRYEQGLMGGRWIQGRGDERTYSVQQERGRLGSDPRELSMYIISS